MHNTKRELAKQKAQSELYLRLDNKEEEKHLYQLAEKKTARLSCEKMCNRLV